MHTPDDCSQLLLPVSNFVSFSRCSCSWSGFYYIFAAILVGRHAGQDGFTRPLWALCVPPATPIRGEGDALEGWEWQWQVGPILAWLCSNSCHSLLLDSFLSQPPDFDSLRNVCSKLGHLKNKASCCQWQYTSSFYPSSVGTSGWRSLHVPAWITCRLRRGRRERGKINVRTWQLHFCLSATVKI